ncbi:MAG: hypothetical protein GXP38_00850 [Chloroflexi bacterium]|nr:hypothetical protein [Chloroflexota bacterium]
MKKQSLFVFTLAASLLLLTFAGALSLAQPLVPGSAPPLAPTTNSWSSGWVDIAPGQTLTFTHNLGGDWNRYAVDIWFRDTRNGGLGIHRRGYGGMTLNQKEIGAFWHHLTMTSISVTRLPDDPMVGQIRLRVWIPEDIAYDSDWQRISQNKCITITHHLGGDVNAYTTGMKFMDQGLPGYAIHQFALGGKSEGGTLRGGFLQYLTNESVQFCRNIYDVNIHQVRLFINRPDPPSYDSGWRTLPAGRTITFTHGLKGNLQSYIVRLSYQGEDLGITSFAYGGMEVNGTYHGANWQNLTNNTIRVHRFADDLVAEKVRVRIWATTQVYLPLVTMAPPQETELAYDDGTAESNQSYDTGNGFAVRFTPPAGGAKLLRARFYFIAPVAPIKVHVWDTDHYDLFPSITATPSGDGWFEVDLSAQNLTLNEDFYLGFKYTQDYAPTLGVDTSAPDGRSWEWPWEAKTNLDYMIRAVVLTP